MSSEELGIPQSCGGAGKVLLRGQGCPQKGVSLRYNHPYSQGCLDFKFARKSTLRLSYGKGKGEVSILQITPTGF